MLNKSKKQFAFDLRKKDFIQQAKCEKNPYTAIRNFFMHNNTIHIQGSVYITCCAMTNLEEVALIQKFKRKEPIVYSYIKDSMTMTDVSKTVYIKLALDKLKHIKTDLNLEQDN